MQTAVMLIAIAAIALIIYFGSKLNINIGILAIPVALVLNVFVLGTAPSEILAMWPTTIALNLLAILFFYSFVMQNGVMKYIAESCTYAIRKAPVLFPFIVFGITFLIAMTGILPTMISPLLLPMFFGIADRLKVNKGSVVTWQLCGSYSGSMMPSSASVDMYRGFIEKFAPEVTGTLLDGTMREIIILKVSAGMIAFVVYYLICRGWKCGRGVMNPEEVFKAPEPLDARQKKCMAVFAVTMLLVIVPKTLAFLGIAGISALAAKLDITLVFISAGVVCALLDLGDVNTILKTKIPWNVPIMIFGMSAMFDVLNRCGLTEILGSMISSSMPHAAIIVVYLIIAAVLTTISDGMAVVVPLTFPLAWGIYNATGVSLGALFTAAIMGLSVCGCFPLSSGGALIMSIIPQEEHGKYFKTLSMIAGSNALIYAVIIAALSFAI